MFSLDMRVERDIKINESNGKVSEYLSNFQNWKEWSPWLKLEPGCEVNINGAPGQIGHSQKWNGEVIGSGQMSLVEKSDKELRYHLQFLKPWKSKADVSFQLSPSGESTQVEWKMKSRFPIFLFFMKNMMESLVGMDYERGLGMMKEALESGEVNSDTEFNGIEERKPMYYIGRRTQCDLDSIGKKMEDDLRVMGKYLEEGSLPKPEGVFSLYKDFDFVKRRCDYTTGFLYSSEQQRGSLSDSFVVGSMPSHRALKMSHQGPYRFLGNAWSAIHGFQRAKKHKVNKNVSMYEIYLNDPEKVKEENIQTELYLPVK